MKYYFFTFSILSYLLLSCSSKNDTDKLNFALNFAGSNKEIYIDQLN